MINDAYDKKDRDTMGYFDMWFAYHENQLLNKREVKTFAMEPLTDKEKKLVGFALFNSAMKIGPSFFEVMEVIIDKIGVREEFEYYAKAWVDYANSTKINKS